MEDNFFFLPRCKKIKNIVYRTYRDFLPLYHFCGVFPEVEAKTKHHKNTTKTPLEYH